MFVEEMVWLAQPWLPVRAISRCRSGWVSWSAVVQPEKLQYPIGFFIIIVWCCGLGSQNDFVKWNKWLPKFIFTQIPTHTHTDEWPGEIEKEIWEGQRNCKARTEKSRIGGVNGEVKRERKTDNYMSRDEKKERWNVDNGGDKQNVRNGKQTMLGRKNKWSQERRSSEGEDAQIKCRG